MKKNMISKIISVADADPSGLIRNGLYIAQALRNVRKLRRETTRYLRRKHITASCSDTFFILGSGASVCELNQEDFSHIEKNVSIGVNTWPFHPFVPDIYAFEHFSVPGKKIEKIEEALNSKKVTNKNPYLLVKDSVFGVSPKQRIKIPKKLKSNTYYYTSVPILTRKPSLLSRAYGDFIRLQSLGLIPYCCAADRGASIVRLASIGVLSGFKKIVFVGVDLNSTKHFWEEDQQVARRWNTKELSSDQTGKVHETNDPEKKRFTVTQVLKAMQEVALANHRVSMWVESSESALSSFMDIYKFPHKS